MRLDKARLEPQEADAWDDDVKAIKTDIIYCSVTGYGQEGEKAGDAAYDSAIQASSGMMSQTGFAENGPTRIGFMPVDMSTGLNAAFAISAAFAN